MPLTGEKGIPGKVGLGEAATFGVGTGARQLPDMSTFILQSGVSGYQKLPSGLIIQWIVGPTAGTETTAYPVITFPVTFPRECFFAGPFTVGNNTELSDQIFQSATWTSSTVKVFPQWFGTGRQGLVYPIILALGW